jgi:hypothetical protein
MDWLIKLMLAMFSLLLVNNNDVPHLTIGGQATTKMVYTEGDNDPPSLQNVRAVDPDNGLIQR